MVSITMCDLRCNIFEDNKYFKVCGIGIRNQAFLQETDTFIKVHSTLLGCSDSVLMIFTM